MLWKILSALIVFLLVIFSLSFAFENMARTPVELKVNYLNPESLEFVDYGDVPVFLENLRFSHNLISYEIDNGCDNDRKSDMIAAFNIFSEEVKIVSFYEFSKDALDAEDADIKIECSDDFVGLGKNLFAAGEGGPSRIINTSGFKVIEEGTILLYDSVDCDYPIVALHELGHVFGFDHSDDPKNIMYNTSGCGQRMSEDMVELMVELYSIEALGDAKIKSVDGIIKGRYLDFNISVLNEGLVEIDDIDLTIFANGEEIDVMELGEIEIGYGRTLRVENLRLPGSTEKIEFVLDAEDLVRELNEGNNVVEMVA